MGVDTDAPFLGLFRGFGCISSLLPSGEKQMTAGRHVLCWNGTRQGEGGWLSAHTGFWGSQDVGTVLQRLQEDPLWAPASQNANFLQTWGACSAENQRPGGRRGLGAIRDKAE